MSPRLRVLPVSPWSERAAWAMHHHRIAYVRTEHVPLVDELVERWRRRTLRAHVRAPTLETERGERIEGSAAIARWADAHGEAAPLWPREHDGELWRWHVYAERALEAARAVTTRQLRRDPRTWSALLPEPIPAPARRWLAPIGRQGLDFVIQKYALNALDDQRARAQQRRAFAPLLEALDQGLEHLVGERFTWADVAMATALQLVAPPGPEYLEVPAPVRAAQTQHELIEELDAALAWRDALYARHRGLPRPGDGAPPA